MKFESAERADMDPIRVEFEWTKTAYQEAQDLYLGTHRKILRFFIFVSLAISLLALGLLLIGERMRNDPATFSIALKIAVVATIMAFTPKLQKLIQSYAFKLDRLEGKPISYSFSSESIHMCSPDAESKVKWNHFNRWMEGTNLFVLLAGRIMYMVPKDRLAGRESDLRDLLTEKIGPKGKKRK